MKRLLEILLASVFVISLLFCVACFGDNTNSGNGERDDKIFSIYNIYVVNAESNGETPLSYDEWLAGIKGEDGKSAYELWIEQGNDGDEEDFIQSLKGATIDYIEFDEQGKLVITLTDGTKIDGVSLPTNTVQHNYGGWIVYNADAYCHEKLYYKVCADCENVEWKKGTDFDHNYKVYEADGTCQSKDYVEYVCRNCNYTYKDFGETFGFCEYGEEYLSDDTYHWQICTVCGIESEKSYHSEDSYGACAVCSLAIKPTEGITYELSEDNSYAMVKSYDGVGVNIKILDTYEEVPVTKIGENAFKDSKIVSVIIPETIEIIDKGAFYGCENLMEIYLPDSVTTINENAFKNCTGVKKLTMGASVRYIGYDAFYKCGNEDVNYGVNKIIYNGDLNDWATIDFHFDGISVNEANPLGWNSSLYLGEWLVTEAYLDCEAVSPFAFAYYKKLESVVLSEKVKKVGSSAFYACNALKKLSVSDNIEFIDGGAFSFTSIPFNTYGKGNYYGNERNPYAVLVNTESSVLETFEIHPLTRVIQRNAFEHSGAIKNIIIPNSVRIIGENAFYCCYDLEYITLGRNVKYIGLSAFYGCNSLKRVDYLGTIDEWAKIEFEYSGANPASYTGGLYINGILQTDITVNVETISAYAFFTWHNLNSVNLGNNVKIIENDAFHGCDGIKEVIIPDSVTSIGTGVFEYCRSLESVTLSKNITVIPSMTFYGCNALQNVSLHEGITEIGGNSFTDCFMLSDITLPSSIKKIGGYAFDDCSSIKQIKYNGNISDWETVEKGTNWHHYKTTSVMCLDGNVTL